MNSEEFANSVRNVLRPQIISSTIRGITKPAGRRPSTYRLDRSQWFNSLSQADQEWVKRIIADGVDAAIFGLFVIIDGDSTLEAPSENRGHFELTYIDPQGNRTRLNPPNEIGLHDLFNVNES